MQYLWRLYGGLNDKPTYYNFLVINCLNDVMEAFAIFHHSFFKVLYDNISGEMILCYVTFISDCWIFSCRLPRPP